MNDEEFKKLMQILGTLKEDVRRLQAHEVSMQAAFSVLKDLVINGLAKERDLPAEEAEEIFHHSVAKKYEAMILRIGDSDPDFARSIDLHQQRDNDWRSE